MAHDTTSRQRQYWLALYSVLRQAGGVVQGRDTAPGERFADFAVGRGGFSLCARIYRDCIAVELSIVDPDADSFFDRLQRQRHAIHDDLGYDLLWLARGPRSKRYRRISTHRHKADFQTPPTGLGNIAGSPTASTSSTEPSHPGSSDCSSRDGPHDRRRTHGQRMFKLAASKIAKHEARRMPLQRCWIPRRACPGARDAPAPLKTGG